MPAAAAAVDASSTTEETVDSLLEMAEEAAARGSATDFQDCEALIADRLGRDYQHRGCPTSFVAYAGDVLSELDRLRAQLSPTDGTTEDTPPEPQPVAEERVAEMKQRSRKETFDLPVVVNAEVTSLIDYYTGDYRERLIVALTRASHIVPYIREQLAKAGLPQDLAYLPLVESAFNPRARSRAHAEGLWQFMAGTARLYSLRCDSLVDERNDPYLSTQAAVAHLAELYADFGDWELALAAYNSGAGRVDRAIRRAHGSRDFWQIRRYLPRETRNYVPALWAALVVAKNPDAYGLPHIEADPPCLARVRVEGALDLAVLADHTSFDEAELADLNPALTYHLTPSSGHYDLAVPCDRRQEVEAALDGLPPGERVRRFIHVVRRGDTLGAIARRYGSSVGAIMAASHVHNPRRLHIGQKLIVPRDPADHHGSRRLARRSLPSHYVVRRGDTLFDIARRFGTSVKTIQRMNGLTDSTIHPGDVLQLAE